MVGHCCLFFGFIAICCNVQSLSVVCPNAWSFSRTLLWLSFSFHDYSPLVWFIKINCCSFERSFRIMISDNIPWFIMSSQNLSWLGLIFVSGFKLIQPDFLWMILIFGDVQFFLLSNGHFGFFVISNGSLSFQLETHGNIMFDFATHCPFFPNVVVLCVFDHDKLWSEHFRL